jgi:glycerophosphoryl diester phosphodiesterase
MVKNHISSRKESGDKHRPLIIAHRGASTEAPENTIAAIRKAIAAGADGIEIDVRLARDGVPVVIHDGSLKRTGGIKGKVADMTSEELSAIGVGAYFRSRRNGDHGAAFEGETIPGLADVLRELSGYRGRIYVELKCKDSGIEGLVNSVCEMIANDAEPSRFVLKSFRLGAIPLIKRLSPGVRTAALFAPKIMNILRKEKHLVKIAEEFGADELSVHYSLATKKLVRNAERRDLPVTIWTVDNPRWLTRGIRLGYAGLITNDPAGLVAARRALLSE